MVASRVERVEEERQETAQPTPTDTRRNSRQGAPPTNSQRQPTLRPCDLANSRTTLALALVSLVTQTSRPRRHRAKIDSAAAALGPTQKQSLI